MLLVVFDTLMKTQLAKKEVKNFWNLYTDFTFLSHSSFLHIDTQSLFENVYNKTHSAF